MSYSTCLACKTTTTYVYKYIELINSLGCYERLTYNYFQGLKTKVLVDVSFIDCNLAGSRYKVYSSDRFFFFCLFRKIC